MTMQEAISILMRNDSNATWDECEAIEELVAGLKASLLDDETGFYARVLASVKGE